MGVFFAESGSGASGRQAGSWFLEHMESVPLASIAGPGCASFFVSGRAMGWVGENVGLGSLGGSRPQILWAFISQTPIRNL